MLTPRSTLAKNARSITDITDRAVFTSLEISLPSQVVFLPGRGIFIHFLLRLYKFFTEKRYDFK